MSDTVLVRFARTLRDSGAVPEENEGCVQAPAGATLHDAARLARIPIVSTCGGKGTCGKCRVRVHGALNLPTATERHLLGTMNLSAGLRLACQAIPAGEVTVEVPATSRAAVILTGGIRRQLTPRPYTVEVVVSVPLRAPVDRSGTWPSDGDGSQAAAVLESLAARGKPHCSFSLPALQKLPSILRRSDSLRLTLVGDQVVDVAAPDQRSELCGIAFDIGTTTVVGYLLNLNSGEVKAIVSALNPQSGYGADVVARLTAASADANALDALRDTVRSMLNTLTRQAAERAGIAVEHIYEAVVVGNTAMHHLFLGIHPAGLLYAPYSPVIVKPMDLAACDAGLHIAPAGRLHLLPNIGSYIGADTTAVALATGLGRSGYVELAIDLGTNGEIVLGNRGRLVACSTAAGPAFEGARISCGMLAMEGAIDRVEFGDGALVLHTIGGGAPRGLCGSGLVDCVALLVRHGAVKPDGRFARDSQTCPGGVPLALAERVVSGERGYEFLLAEDETRVTVTQKDVRELQLAKGAVRAGITVLLKELGVKPPEVTRVYLAGAFGNYVRVPSAEAIGLWPRFPRARVIPVGNAAGTGAQMALVSKAARVRAAVLARSIEHIDLATRADFQEEFAAGMRLCSD